MSRPTCSIQPIAMHSQAHWHAFCAHRLGRLVVVVLAVRVVIMAEVVLVVEYMTDVGSRMNNLDMGLRTAIVTKSFVDVTPIEGSLLSRKCLS